MATPIAINLNSGTYQSSLVKPFGAGTRTKKTEEQLEAMLNGHCNIYGLDPEEERQGFFIMLAQEFAKPCFVNDIYMVSAGRAQKGSWPMVQLSIKRHDKEPIDENHWRILQEIKNIIVGPKHEAAELYPAEQRLMDAANQYHLWVLAEPCEKRSFPFGYFEPRSVATPEQAIAAGAKQRELHDGYQD